MKTRILFVDDEPNVLSALRRMFHDMRGEWEMDFAQDGPTGLTMIAEQPFDVVVADMRMPGMDGAMFLREAQIHNPGAIRIVLSGHSDRDMIMQTVRPAHQFLQKPCRPEELKAVISRGLSLREVFLDERVKNVVAKLDQLPTVPRLYAALLDVLAQEDPSVREVSALIAQDVGMAAGLLKLVNSAFFGLRTHVSSPAHAVNLLGLDVVKALVLGVGLFGRFDKEAFHDFDLEKLWSHCLGTARLAREIAAQEDAPSEAREHCYIAGLLHDVGKLVMATNFPELYLEVIRACQAGQGTILDMEQHFFGASHAEVGAYLLGLWGVEDAVVRAVYLHHEPGRDRRAGFSPLLAVHVANRLEHELVVISRDYAINPLDELYLAASGLAPRLPVWREACQKVLEQGGADSGG
ncbi:response regulator [Desulfovibrio sp. TomC]|uniref:response regulator n=1 Tax=Desulfovibrio sp. TomC TaxID=1562888 RepID=UPI000575124C|nr:response regulator [Desulfovibrio sp. TomC]KHK03643.1 response regulator receiver protein [Desulfovibrio sp. TomC]